MNSEGWSPAAARGIFWGVWQQVACRLSEKCSAMVHRLTTVILVAVIGVFASAADMKIAIPEGETASGRCVGVHDGDSITVLLETPDGPRQAKIRLDAIDAPELGQPNSRASRVALAEMVFERECAVEGYGADTYGRTIRRVPVDRLNVNAVMLEEGMAWHFKEYEPRPAMAAREDTARRAGIGLWEERDPIQPWDWRKMPKADRDAVHTTRLIETE